MTFIFYYENDDQKKELETILELEYNKHFSNGSYGNIKPFHRPLEPEYKMVQCGFEVEIPNSIYFEDLQQMKDSVYKQNKYNGWHNLIENPSDLPDSKECDIYNAKIDNSGNVVILAYNPLAKIWDYVDKYGDNEPLKETVLEWKEIDSQEILLFDFMSDVEENLSFVPHIEVGF